MAVKNLYPNLPGHLVEFKDGGLQLTSNTQTTSNSKSLLILGTAFDGPINEPVKIDDTTVSQLFGSDVGSNGYPNGATLTKYAKQAFKNGFTDVRCMRVTGSKAYVEVNKTTVSSTEQVDGEVVTIQAEGNAAVQSIQLSRMPLVLGGLDITTGPDGTGTRVSASSYDPYNANMDIPSNVITKNSTLYAKYKYIGVKDKNGFINDSTDVTDLPQYSVPAPITKAKKSGDEGGFTETSSDSMLALSDGLNGIIAVELDFDPTTEKESIYVTPKTSGSYDDNSGKLPVTDGLKITCYTDGLSGSSNVLEADTDYTLSGNIITFKGDNVHTGDSISVEYYVCKELEATDTIKISSDENQDIVLKNTPIAETVVVKVNGEPIKATEYYTVSDKTVSLIAGKFNINSTVEITYKYEKVTTETEGMIVQSMYGGSVYKEASISITEETSSDGLTTGRRFTFTKPASKKYGDGDKPFYFTSFDCPTVGILKQALSEYSLNNVFEIIVDDENISTDDFPVFNSALINGGDDGVVVTNNQMFEALSGKRNEDGYLTEQGAYQILENYNCDYIYVAGVYADSEQTVAKYTDFHHELALLCAVLSYRTKMTHGFIDVKPNSNTTLVGIQNYVNKLASINNLHYMRDTEGNDIVDSQGNKMDIGWYTSIVVGPEPVMSSDTLGTYYGSPAIAYAALCASLKPQSAPTNKALPGVKGMKYKFSNKQMDTLVGNRMVVFRLKNEGSSTATSTPYVVDGMTCGAPNCDYARISTVKVVTDVVDQIREVADPFIGEPNTIEQRNALSALISKRLSYLLEQGEIHHYEFEINATIQQVLLGECSISLTLVCPTELRKITTVVALRAAA